MPDLVSLGHLWRALGGKAAIEQGARQVLVLGAGFDTLCLRLAPQYPHVRFFEVDHPASTSSRSRLVFTHAIPGQRKMLSIMTGLIGETWKSAVRSEDLPEYVEGTGWTIISDVDTDSAHGVERFAVAERR